MSDAYSKIILVTGANDGVGFEIAKQLAEKGHKVYVGARREEAGKEAVAKLTQKGLDAHFLLLDVTNPESVKAAKELFEKENDRLDVLVNNAGILCAFANPSEGDYKEYQRVFDTNVFGVISVTTTFMPLIKKAKPGYGAVVNVTSGLGSNYHNATAEEGRRYNTANAYSVSKAALNSYTIGLANELRDQKIRVNCICPGLVKTKFNGYMEAGKSPEDAGKLLVPWALLGPQDDDKTCQFYSNGEVRAW
ncbi:short-chain dehydrogenase reductase sdr [Moniliophthora roreri MCA 2997]|uniref:Short-chain dehydrogenase reductase sdr n=2 Tax=Moniliophthora roreri TaxID=221103 RepID=V2XEC8_MONRO|nr:short-chain dehydrogenase reductase sdr [Moniliophthora roreri MCA 2997]